jgi:uncharacterized ferritin-like protein (DUF455 family)
MTSLRDHCLAALLVCDPNEKAALALSINLAAPTGQGRSIPEPNGVPGRAERPELVRPSEVQQRSLTTVEGRAALIHALAHIELNAVNLACDITWRFDGMPDAFYRDWAGVAKEEAYHFTLLRDHLHTLGSTYGAFPAHNALWEMAEKTKNDILARLALVPRTLEARGLDASPLIKAKLVQAGDLKAGEILDLILRDEIGHVAIGNRWYRYLCEQRAIDHVATYAALAEQYRAPRLKAPFNMDARRAAGFDEAELRAL